MECIQPDILSWIILFFFFIPLNTKVTWYLLTFLVIDEEQNKIKKLKVKENSSKLCVSITLLRLEWTSTTTAWKGVIFLVTNDRFTDLFFFNKKFLFFLLLCCCSTPTSSKVIHFFYFVTIKMYGLRSRWLKSFGYYYFFLVLLVFWNSQLKVNIRKA